jgi:hypothetical protein
MESLHGHMQEARPTCRSSGALDGVCRNQEPYQMTTTNDALREALLKFRRTLAASKPEQQAERAQAWNAATGPAKSLLQQAQAEPQVLYWNEVALPNGTEVITLQSYREAIAKKDAALDACVEALGTCQWYDDGGMGCPTYDGEKVYAAIEQAKEERG